MSHVAVLLSLGPPNGVPCPLEPFSKYSHPELFVLEVQNLVGPLSQVLQKLAECHQHDVWNQKGQDV